MRAAAQIDEAVLAIERDLLALGNRCDDFGLVALAQVAEELDRFVARHHLPLDRQIALSDFTHPVLYRREILGERALEREVIVEAVLHYRADRYLGFGNNSFTA